MANYAAIADIQTEFKNMTFNSASPVTDTQVTAFIGQASAYIDSTVGMKYELPIVASAALSVLKNICVFIVVERLKPLLKIDTGGSKGNQAPQTSNLRTVADQMLKDIQSNKTDLAVLGAVLRSSGDGADSNNVRNSITPRFKSDEDQW